MGPGPGKLDFENVDGYLIRTYSDSVARYFRSLQPHNLMDDINFDCNLTPLLIFVKIWQPLARKTFGVAVTQKKMMTGVFADQTKVANKLAACYQVDRAQPNNIVV